MSLVKSKAIQLGFDATPTNNFLIYQPLTPDGTFRIANGNQGATTDIMTVTSGGSVTFAGTTNFSSLNFSAGSESAPSLFPTGDSNTGIWFPAADTFAVSTGGTQRLKITSTGNVGIGTSSPANKLHVIGPQGAVAALPTLLNQTMMITENSFHNRIAMIVPTTAGYECGIAAYGSGDAYPRAAISMVPADKYIGFSTGDGTTAQVTEKMRIDVNGNVGIGTTAPGSKLNVVGGGIAVGAITGENAFAPAAAGIVLAGSNQSGVSTYTSPGNSTTVASISYYADINTGYARYLDIAALGSTQGASSNIRFLTGSATATERMRIDGSGNVGISTTITSGSKVSIQNAAGSTTIGSSLGLLISGKTAASIVGERQEIGFRSWNAYNTYTGSMAGLGIITTNTAGNELADLYFYTAATGTSLTPVERMRITSAGVVGIGVTNPDSLYRVDIGGQLRFGDNKDALTYFDGYNSSNTANAGVISRYITYNAAGTAVTSADIVKYKNGLWYFNNNDTSGIMAFGNAGSERVRITADGSVGISTTTPTARLDLGTPAAANTVNAVLARGGASSGADGGFKLFAGSGSGGGINSELTRLGMMYSTSQYNTGIGFYRGSDALGGWMTFNVNNWTEAARLDVNGAFLVNSTAIPGGLPAKFSVSNSGTYVGAVVFANDAGAAQWTQFVWNKATTGNNLFIQFGTEGTYTGKGGILFDRASGLISYGTSSDYRVKDIEGPVVNAVDTVMQLQPHVGKMHGATQSRPMFVAHELQAVAPYAATGEKDEVDENGNPKLQQVDHSTLVPLLTAAIQELVDQNKELKARLDAAGL